VIMEKSANTILGKSDGPTSVTIIKKNQKLTFKQRIQKLKYIIKKAYVERTIKAESHSLDEVMNYILTKYGFEEVNDDRIKMEYNEMRASFIMQYAPELLGEYATMPKLKSESQEDILEHIKLFQERQEKAKAVPITEFDIDFHKFQKFCGDINDNMYITIEKRFHYIGGGASGNKKEMKTFNRIYKDVYRYYGVTSEDIKNKSKRYEQVVRALTL